MKKFRVISLVLALALLIAVPIGVWAADKAVFSVKTPEILPKAGETFEVTVELANNPGFCAIQFTLGYDKELMECKYAETDEMFDGALSATNPQAKDGAIVGLASLETLSKDGAIAVFGFVAKQDITEFNYTFKNVSFADENLKDIAFAVEGVSEELPPPPAPEEPEDIPPPPVVEEPEAKEPDVNAGEAAGDTGDDKEAKEENDTEIKQEAKEEPAEPAPVPDEPTTEPEGAKDEEAVDMPSFPDVVGHWSEPFVGKAVQQGLFKGDNEGNFRPDDSITRAQFVTVLWRMAGRPETDVAMPFTDVADQIDEFKSAIVWAYANGHVNGMTATTFAPTATLTREAGMKILHSYSGGKTGMEFQFYAIYDGAFKDSAEISDWAKPSVYWGIYNTLISGVTTDTLVPQQAATRAQLAKILVTYLDI